METPTARLPEDGEFRAPGASFVTLRKDGQLRGCIGSTVAHRTLVSDVKDNALGAAFRDPRFTPVEVVELDMIRLEVSVLSRPSPIASKYKADLLRQLAVGIDGLTVTCGGRRATYLPGVWQSFSSREEFLNSLLAKARIADSVDFAELEFERYTTVHSKWCRLDDGSIK